MTFRQALRQLACLAAITALMPLAQAQDPTYHPPVDPRSIVVTTLNHPADLTANWLVHQGDDPAFASPNFDDSQWTAIETAKPLATYGVIHPNIIWYRTHVHIPPGQHNLALLLRYFTGSEQIYINGVPTGPSRPFIASGGTIFPNFDLQSSIPDGVAASGDLTIAMRAQIRSVANDAARVPGFSQGTFILLGDVSVLSDQTSLWTFRDFASNFVNIFMTALVLFIALALALTLRNEPEYLALSLFLAATLAQDLLTVWRETHDVVFNRYVDLPGQGLSAIIVFSGIAFAQRILQLPNSRWIRGYRWVLGSLMVFGATFDAATFQQAMPNHTWIVLVLVTLLLIVIPLNLGLPIFALWIWRRTRNFDALFLSVPLLISALFYYITIAVSILNLFRSNGKILIPQPPTGSFAMQWSEITEFLFTLALLGFLILRTVRLARARAALAAEFVAAENVQQLLLARASQPTPGFVVETAFHPASQVGGDFFLVLPSEDRLIAIVGDVSGKGLTAAMRVAMILGILRRETSRSPATILANLNDALLNQSEMGFTTACCVHMYPDGRFTAANAGHIAPYLAGVEVETDPALPLGIAAEQSYHLVKGHLAANQTLVLMSDGVPEARNAKRELYGFDRLPNLTLLPARDIAAAALRFGQEDDITVLTIAIA